MGSHFDLATIGHLIVGIVIPILMCYTLNKKYSIETILYFLAGSILPDLWTIIRMFIFPDITKYITWNITHGFIVWIIWSFIFTIIFYFSFKRISKLRFNQIFLILLSAGWLHLGLDMLTQPVRIIGNFRLEFLDFFTKFEILKEQDFIIAFYLIFTVVPMLLLLIEIKKGDE